MKTTRNWQIFTTADESPTLIWSRGDGYTEKMHHSGGALTESLFIYRDALRETISRGWPANVLSLGLGLAYNELIALAEILKSNPPQWKVWSFEAEEPLRASFEHWLTGETSELQTIHDDVLERVARSYEISPPELKAFAHTAFRSGHLVLRGSFPEDAAHVTGVACVFYDAYSKKMDAGLWDETALESRLKPLLANQCVLATYASTGSMKRALKMLGFELLPKTGFLGKRESTLAIRI